MIAEPFKAYALITASRGTRLSSSERLVLIHMAMRASSAEGLCWASQPTIAEDTGLSIRQVRSAMADLRDRGVIVRVPSPYASDTYRFDVAALDRSRGRPENGARGGARIRVTPEAAAAAAAAAATAAAPVAAAISAPADIAPAKIAGTGKDCRTPGNDCLSDRQRLPGVPAKTAANPSIDQSIDPISDCVYGASAREPEAPRPEPASDGPSPIPTLLPGDRLPPYISGAEAINACIELAEEVGESITPADQAAIRTSRWSTVDLRLLWAWVHLAPDRLADLARQGQYHRRWATLLNHRRDERLKLARQWDVLGRPEGPRPRDAPTRDRPSRAVPSTDHLLDDPAEP